MAENKGKTEVSEQAKREEAILAFWEREKIFAQTLSRLPTRGDFIFYDGPPFATGMPHFGHLLPTSLKDAIPRYQTMRGRRVARRWGWDCHGLPVENIVEQELGLATKKDILAYGIGRFNEAARAVVLRYTDEWERIIPRLGRWVEMKNAYRTMDPSYTETVWHIFKELHDRGLIYEGYKSMHICPRCETTLANFEVNQGYKEIEDLAVTVKFELVDEPKTYLLAWTTTPWTLPGNVALAVNPDFEYVKVNGPRAGESYIVAADRVEKIFGSDYKILTRFKGRELVGKIYRSVFGYYLTTGEVKGASFVLLEEGTGIVHIAPAFGEDDYELSRQERLPFIQHVGMDGKFKAEVTDFAGLAVKPKDRHQETDKLVLKKLTAEGKVFAIERLTHSYPHCWRCDTPLLNYAATSWFVKVTAYRDDLVAANQRVNWIPAHVKEGRFGKWLLGARDWAISRSRFWGAPLPVWQCGACEEKTIIGSIAELTPSVPVGVNQYVLIRHGESINNLEDRISAQPSNPDGLTPAGQAAVRELANQLQAEGVEIIIHSDFLRTKETAEILRQALGLPPAAVMADPRLGEVKAGDWEGGRWSEYENFFHEHNPLTPIPNGESIAAVEVRLVALMTELEARYRGKKIALISHGWPIFVLLALSRGVPRERLAQARADFGPVRHAFPYQLVWRHWPGFTNGTLDLHRPYLDEVVIPCACGGERRRVPEVFDCWFESGAMPYFEQPGFPADFIAEGLDQTRGWFYSLLALGTALCGQAPYQNVVVNGTILAADGQKMSKRLKNYPDLELTINKYGADALRFYLLSTPAVRAEEIAFSEADLANTYRQVVQRLLNVLNFYETYTATSPTTPWVGSDNLLDQWILARLSSTAAAVAAALDQYELDRATRPLSELIDDLSNWYLRRSRERFKSEEEKDRREAMATTRLVLKELSKILAPLAPFTAEIIWQQLRLPLEPVSVHLAEWPELKWQDDDLIEQMALARTIVEGALALRNTHGLKVRQPLSALRVNLKKLPVAISPAYQESLGAIIAQEINVKRVTWEEDLDNSLPAYALDMVVTPELAAEGLMRDFIRAVQDLRKRRGLRPSESVGLTVATAPEAEQILRRFAGEIERATNTRAWRWGENAGEALEAGGYVFKVTLES